MTGQRKQELSKGVGVGKRTKKHELSQMRRINSGAHVIKSSPSAESFPAIRSFSPVTKINPWDVELDL